MEKGTCRAKRADNYEWAEGAVYDDYIIYGIEWDDEEDTAAPKFTYAEIESTTVGRCTEKIDTNEKLIFEGDIVVFKEWVKGKWNNKGVIEYSDCNFIVSCWPNSEHAAAYEWALCRIESSNIKIVGNIHDNPEKIGTPADDGEEMDLERASEVFELELEKTGLDENLRRAMETAMKVLDRQAHNESSN